MKEISEYTREVFDRSEKRIKEKKKRRKKVLLTVSSFVLVIAVAFPVSFIWRVGKDGYNPSTDYDYMDKHYGTEETDDKNHIGKYNKINLHSEALAGKNDIENALGETKDDPVYGVATGTTIFDETTNVISNVSSKDFPQKLKVYKIVPRKITKEYFSSLALSLGIMGEVRTDISNFEYYAADPESVFPHADTKIYYSNGEIGYVNYKGGDTPITDTDEELIEKAKAVFNSLNLKDEYECVGIESVLTVLKNDEEYLPAKRVAFRRVVDGYRVIGDDYCHIYMCAEGVYSINLTLFDYIENGEIDVMSMGEVISKVTTPDALSVDLSTSKNYSGVAKTLSIDRTKLLLVNQYEDECEILEPVYNLMGIAENENGSIEFSSKIIAIPDKYIK